MPQEFNIPEAAKALEYFQNKMNFTTGPVELNEALKNHQNIQVIDVRKTEDFDKEHIPGAMSLPEESWGAYEELSKDKVNLIYCYSQVCHLGARAAVQLAQAGFPVMELEGGFQGWKKHELPTEGRLSSTVQHTTEPQEPLDPFKSANGPH